MERRKDTKTREAVEDALQRRDIEELTKTVEEGFAGVHARQDTTNGKVLKAAEDIVELKNWRNFITGGLTILSLLIVPIIIYIVTKGL